MRTIILAAAIVIAGKAGAQDGVLIRCGASTGQAYFFQDDLLNPDGPIWIEDGMHNGKIILVRLGDEWDIQFDDSVSAYGYRQDGSTVLPLSVSDEFLMVGAFNEFYTEIYSFDMKRRVVAWTSNKIAPMSKKAAIYHAVCE